MDYLGGTLRSLRGYLRGTPGLVMGNSGNTLVIFWGHLGVTFRGSFGCSSENMEELGTLASYNSCVIEV